MVTAHRSIPPFIRDAVIAVVVAALVLLPAVQHVGPQIVRWPGYLLSLPFMLAYIVLGGETETPHGPSTLHYAIYVVALGVLTATVTHLIRERYDTRAIATWRFGVATILAVPGTVLALAGLLGVVGPVGLSAPLAGVALVIGVVSIGAAIAVANRAGTRDGGRTASD